MDATDEDKWLVIDGLQRLKTIEKFVLKNELVLCNLEFLEQLNGKIYRELPRNLQRKIDETLVTVYKIEKGTPSEVKYHIFKRIKTGGVPFSPQEIRHALHPGQANKFLAELANSEAFKKATNYSIKDRRKTDCEMVLRFLAFSITSYKEYRTDTVLFLNEHMVILNKMTDTELENLKQRFLRAMNAAYEIFGQRAFRKIKEGRYLGVSKPLFEAWAVNLDKLQDEQTELLISRKDRLTDSFINLIKQQDFDNAISVSTGSPQSVKTRFESIENLIKEILEA
jgi:uncharacterized protein with ParB-like and HNH nuclease domain